MFVGYNSLEKSIIFLTYDATFCINFFFIKSDFFSEDHFSSLSLWPQIKRSTAKDFPCHRGVKKRINMMVYHLHQLMFFFLKKTLLSNVSLVFAFMIFFFVLV